MKKKTPLNYIEDTFKQVKKLFEEETVPKSPSSATRLLNELKKDVKSIDEFCNALNQHTLFQEKLKQLNSTNQNSGKNPWKFEDLFFSDLIAIFEQLGIKETAKSRLVLAYYYDGLLNNKFAQATDGEALLQFASTEAFKEKLAATRAQYRIELKSTHSTPYILPALIREDKATWKKYIQLSENFIESAFDLKFKNETEIEAFFATEIHEVTPNESKITEKQDTLEEILVELNSLIGLEHVKKDVQDLINFLAIQKKRTGEGLKNVDITLHTVFLGPPGTGKTTVARLLARIFHHLGFLSKGQLIETDREGLVAGYVGQTATKVKQVIDQSTGGVLFIDEAYALTQNVLGNDYGAEAINTLIKRMEDDRADFAVVVAGYTEPMKQFLESNPGLKSRFNRYFTFDHFSSSQLLEIFELQCKKMDFITTEDARDKLLATFELFEEAKDESFGNARFVRNLFEKCIQNQANRIVKIEKLTQDVLKTIVDTDIPEPNDTFKESNQHSN